MRLTSTPELPTEAEAAVALQERLRELVETAGADSPRFGTVAGLDSAYDDRGNVVAAVVVLDATTLRPVDTATARGKVSFPYVPGLLAFRE
ncbi:endonuclease V, partial [Nocardia gipuzkoensis]